MPDHTVATNIAAAFDGYDCALANRASEAIAIEQTPSAVIMELSLAGHSGFEFLYEFRSYTDWRNIPVIIYSRILLGDEILTSRSFKELGVKYAYQPNTSLSALRELVDKEIASSK